MDAETREAKQVELEKLRSRVAELERELDGSGPVHWEATEFYTGYYATVGFILGMFGAATSLIVNVVGSALIGQHPLRLVQVYLTFPLGERALELDSSMTLAIGCCLYFITGMLLGAPFHLLLAWTALKANLAKRIGIALFLSGAMWFVHFYMILIWLQPLLFGGDWIIDLIPPWVGLVTHLVYGVTMALIFPLGQYVPYRRQTEHA